MLREKHKIYVTPLPPLDKEEIKQTDALIAEADGIIAKMDSLIAGLDLPVVP
jgi:hypothetical protein